MITHKNILLSTKIDILLKQIFRIFKKIQTRKNTTVTVVVYICNVQYKIYNPYDYFKYNTRFNFDR